MEPTSNSNDTASAGGFNLLSPTLRRVLDALLEGRAIDSKDQAALTEGEWGELRALARTANLTRLALHQPDPNPNAEAEALARAQKVLQELGPRTAQHGSSIVATQESDDNRPTWLDRLRHFLKIESQND